MKKLLSSILIMIFVCSIAIDVDAASKNKKKYQKKTKKVVVKKAEKKQIVVIPKTETIIPATSKNKKKYKKKQQTKVVIQQQSEIETTIKPKKKKKKKTGSNNLIADSVDKKGSKNTLTKFKAKKKKKTQKETYTAYQKAKKENPIVKNVSNINVTNVTVIKERRSSFYRDYTPPSYAYRTHSSYGSWDSRFLWWSLRNNPDFFYHHRHDPGISLWKAAVLGLAVNEISLRNQLDRMEDKIERLERQKVKVNRSYLPENVDETIALSEETISSAIREQASIKLATASRDGLYFKKGIEFKRNVSDTLEIKLETSNGSYDNLLKIKRGEVDAAIVQYDALNLFYNEYPEINIINHATLHAEYVYLIVNKKSKIKSINDLSKRNVVYVGPKNSGAEITWKNFRLLKSKFKKIRYENAANKQAILKVLNDKNTAFLYIGSKDSKFIKDLKKYKKKVKLVKIADKDLNDKKDHLGNRIYEFSKVKRIGAAFRKVKTLKLNAVLVVSPKWKDKVDTQIYDDFSDAVLRVYY